MVNRHSPRKNKFQRQNESSDILLQDDESREQVWKEDDDRLNLVPTMSEEEKVEAVSFISDRINTATDQTSAMRKQMKSSNMQYEGEWQEESDDIDSDDDIFLPMTREDINSVRAFLISILAQLLPIVRMRVLGSGTIWTKLEEDVKRAKLAEAMFDYYWREQWKAVDDVMPQFLTHFLKYPMGIMKVSYYETDYDPDLKLEVIDRGFLYLDPHANKIQDCGWIGHEYYVPMSEVHMRVDRGDWDIDSDILEGLQTITSGTPETTDMERWFGKRNTSTTTLEADELVRCMDYYQFPRKGLTDVYATTIGTSGTSDTSGLDNGILVRYGRNPYPVKGNPFIGGSFNPSDRPDGQSMAMLQEPFQRVANTLYNIRVKDIRKNVRDATFMLRQMVDKTTLLDLRSGKRLIRLGKQFSDWVMASSDNKKVSDFFGQFPSGTSTEGVMADLQFILAMGQKSANTPDVFRGMNAQPGATLGQIQEQLSRATGQFTPVIRAIMRIIEMVAQHTTAYFRSEDFYDEERIIMIIGKDKYEDVLKDNNWFRADRNTAYKSVTPDMVDVDMVFNAVSGADMIASRTLLITMFERIMQALGQIPEMYQEVKKTINFSSLFMKVLDVNGVDIEGITYSDKEQLKNDQIDKEQAEKEQQLQQQQQEENIQLQAKLKMVEAKIDILVEDKKQEAMKNKQIIVDKMKNISNTISQTEINAENLELQNDLNIDEMNEKARLERINKSHDTDEEIRLQSNEAALEEDAFERGKTVSVGKGQRNVEVDHGSTEES